MLVDFFFALRQAGLQVSIREFLALLAALQQGVVGPSVEELYYLARLTLIKHETQYDRFDRVFQQYFKSVGVSTGEPAGHSGEMDASWLQQRLDDIRKRAPAAQRHEYEELAEALKQLLQEQTGRHAGGNKWVGTGGSSAFGNAGQHPEGIRIGGDSRTQSAVKVWETRLYRDYDDRRELGTRSFKTALQRLRKFARQGAADELALDDTIRATAHNGGVLDLKMRPARKSQIKVLMLLDVGGSMDAHIQLTEQLFSAARSQFRNMAFLYFHNCPYESLWRSAQRQPADVLPTWDVIHTYPSDTRLIFVGDATMSPHEILRPGGAVDYSNEEPGQTWLQRLTQAFPHFVWLNPVHESNWPHRQSLMLLRHLMQERMFPVTLDGLERGMQRLSK